MRRPLVALLALLACLAAAGCGGIAAPVPPAVPPLPEEGSAPAAATPGAGRARIVVVTHGQASDPFWSVVRRGVDDAARQLDVTVDYEAPDSYDVARMARLIDAAVASRPAGLVVSLPDPAGLAPAVRRAVAAGIPVISINSGSGAFRGLGIPVHVGQAEYAAGRAAGKRLAATGARRALCVIHEQGNRALHERCRGVAEALATVGGSVRTLTVDLQDSAGAVQAMARALRRGGVDSMVTLGGAAIAGSAISALHADGLAGKLTYATFGLGTDTLRALRTGELAFAVDQHPYLQGYLPIVLLAQYRLYGLLPAAGTLIPTGPVFVTKANAARVLALSGRGLR
jgi:simple sugar transport system substrate-binding protein